MPNGTMELPLSTPQVRALAESSMLHENTKKICFRNSFVRNRSVPGKSPLLGKRPCAEFQGVTIAASIQFISRVSAHAGQNHELC